MTVISTFWPGIVPIISFLLVVALTCSLVERVYVWKKKFNISASRIRNKEIIIIEDEDDWEYWFSVLILSFQIHPFIGLDCEWVTDADRKRHKVALLQIASVDGLCLLVRLNRWKSSFPDSLVEFLRDQTILKAGVGIGQDCLYLRRDYRLLVLNWVDLRNLNLGARRIATSRCGLAALAMDYLFLHVDKDWRVSCSNWEVDELSFHQMKYAANDAYVGALLYQKISMELIKSSFLETPASYWKRVDVNMWPYRQRVYEPFTC